MILVVHAVKMKRKLRISKHGKSQMNRHTTVTMNGREENQIEEAKLSSDTKSVKRRLKGVSLDCI